MKIKKLFRLKRKIRRPEYWNNLNREDSKPPQITLRKGMDVTRLLEADKLKELKQILRNEIAKSETIISHLIIMEKHGFVHKYITKDLSVLFKKPKEIVK